MDTVVPDQMHQALKMLYDARLHSQRNRAFIKAARGHALTMAYAILSLTEKNIDTDENLVFFLYLRHMERSKVEQFAQGLKILSYFSAHSAGNLKILRKSVARPDLVASGVVALEQSEIVDQRYHFLLSVCGEKSGVFVDLCKALKGYNILTPENAETVCINLINSDENRAVLMAQSLIELAQCHSIGMLLDFHRRDFENCPCNPLILTKALIAFDTLSGELYHETADQLIDWSHNPVASKRLEALAIIAGHSMALFAQNYEVFLKKELLAPVPIAQAFVMLKNADPSGALLKKWRGEIIAHPEAAQNIGFALQRLTQSTELSDQVKSDVLLSLTMTHPQHSEIQKIDWRNADTYVSACITLSALPDEEARSVRQLLREPYINKNMVAEYARAYVALRKTEEWFWQKHSPILIDLIAQDFPRYTRPDAIIDSLILLNDTSPVLAQKWEQELKGLDSAALFVARAVKALDEFNSGLVASERELILGARERAPLLALCLIALAQKNTTTNRLLERSRPYLERIFFDNTDNTFIFIDHQAQSYKDYVCSQVVRGVKKLLAYDPSGELLMKSWNILAESGKDAENAVYALKELHHSGLDSLENVQLLRERLRFEQKHIACIQQSRIFYPIQSPLQSVTWALALWRSEENSKKLLTHQNFQLLVATSWPEEFARSLDYLASQKDSDVLLSITNRQVLAASGECAHVVSLLLCILNDENILEQSHDLLQQSMTIVQNNVTQVSSSVLRSSAEKSLMQIIEIIGSLTQMRDQKQIVLPKEELLESLEYLLSHQNNLSEMISTLRIAQASQAPAQLWDLLQSHKQPVKYHYYCGHIQAPILLSQYADKPPGLDKPPRKNGSMLYKEAVNPR